MFLLGSSMGQCLVSAFLVFQREMQGICRRQLPSELSVGRFGFLTLVTAFCMSQVSIYFEQHCSEHERVFLGNFNRTLRKVKGMSIKWFHRNICYLIFQCRFCCDTRWGLNPQINLSKKEPYFQSQIPAVSFCLSTLSIPILAWLVFTLVS